MDPIELIHANGQCCSPRAPSGQSHTPEFFALHGTADRLVSDVGSERFMARYLGDGGQGRLALLPGQTHTSMLRADSAAYRSLIAFIVDAATGR